jgi:two-component system OmpR family sensor kinase
VWAPISRSTRIGEPASASFLSRPPRPESNLIPGQEHGIDPQVQQAARDAYLGDLQSRIARLVGENDELRAAVLARDSFLAVAAHELRNPMTPILGRVTLLRRAVLRGDTSADDIALRLEGLERLVMQYIKRATTLLDVSRIASDHLKVDCHPLNVRALAAEVIENFRPLALHAGATLALESVVDEDVVAIGDRGALEQVLENLISNAIKYGDGAPIAVAVAADASREVVTIVVRDDGPGISETHQSRIFERFERAVVPGSGTTGYGVGLWIVRNLCEAMAGSIDVRSTAGHGSTFSVTLPLSTTKETP